MRISSLLRMIAAAGVALAAAALPTLRAQNENAAQGANAPELRAELERVRDAALASDYALRQLKHLTNNIGPRLAGSPQAQFAAEYVAGEMSKLGLSATLEKTAVPHWVRGVETGELVEYAAQAPGTTQKVVLTALGGSNGTPAAGITAEVVVVHSYDELKALGRAGVAGKMVLFNVLFDKQMAAQNEPGPAYGQAVAYRGGGAKAAEELGAVAALVRSVGGAEFRLPHTGAMAPAGIPAAAVTAEDADLIADLAGQGRVRMHLTLGCQTLPDAVSANVIADWKGTEHPEQVVIVSGHLDSWDLGTGAIDDGAGVATAMGVAAVLAQLGIHPRRTLRVIAWMDEEHNGSGSKTYARDHAEEFPDHVAAIEMDFGPGHPLGMEVFASQKARDALWPVMDVLRPIGAWLVRPAEGPPGSDVEPMGEAGVPTMAPIVDGRTYFNYHHTAADTFDKIDPKNLAENVALMAVVADALAQMPERLPR